MSKGFIKLSREELTEELVLKHPNAFILLTIIALRARREDSPLKDSLVAGQALIGDYEYMGLTEQKYRTAKKVLENNGLITTRATNRGTIATLVNTMVYDVNIHSGNEQGNADITNKQRTDNEQITTNKKERTKEGKNKDIVITREQLSLIPDDTPDWFPTESWKEFTQHRKTQKAPMSELAESRMKKEMEKFFHEGQNLEEVINQSIMNGWKGIFRIKGTGNEQRNSSTQRSGASKFDRYSAALDDDLTRK